MASFNLLEIEPEELFEVYAVNEVEEVLSNVTNEIERKRVELRTLVGERYRELIEAADKINEMETLSRTVIKDVEVLNFNISLINKSSSESRSIKTSKILPRNVAIAHLKLLNDLPNLIWSHIDNKDLIKAAQLYLLGRHIRTGFSFDHSLKDTSFGTSILEEQRIVLSKFPDTILKKAEAYLADLNIDPTDSAKWLVTIGLLESGCLVDRFLTLRYSCLLKLLQVDSNVKSRIIDSYTAIISSIEAFHHCFCGDSSGNGRANISYYIEVLNQPVVHHLGLLSNYSHLSTIITNFRVKWNGLISSGDLKKKLNDWLMSVESLVSTQGTALLNNISSLRGLEQIDNNPDMPLQDRPLLLNTTAREFGSDLWSRIYYPLITCRARQLLTSQWEEALTHIYRHITNLIQDDISSELDLRRFVWKENLSDLNFEECQNYTDRGLWLKGQGISPRVLATCKMLESEVAGVSGQGGSSLAFHHAARASSMLLSLKQFLSDLCYKDVELETVEGNQISQAALNHAALLAEIARFLHSVPLLCPSLHKALSHSSDPKTAAAWHEAKTLLNAESLAMWSRWETAMAFILTQEIDKTMNDCSSFSSLLDSIPIWEKIIIEEEESKKSEVKVPSAPSLPLHNCLHLLTSKLTRVHIPRLIQENILTKLVPVLLSYIPEDFICQFQALQALFDVKFLSHHFVSSAHKEVHSQCLSKIKLIESKIDPFDLDVYSPHIHLNVKQSVMQTQCLFGTGLVIKDASFVSKMSEDPNIIVLSKASANLWFPPLPVTNPSYKHLHLNKTKPSRSSKMRPINVETKTLNSSNMAASSFFTEWFG